MLSSMEELNPESASGVHTRIRCIFHILNLVVKVSFQNLKFLNFSADMSRL